MSQPYFRRTFLAALLVALLGVPAHAAAPDVVVSVKPLHSLVAGVMDGVGTPTLLVTGANSPHTFTLRPSDARHLQAAALIVWVGPALETFLVKPLANLGAGAAILELDRAPELTILPARTGGLWERDPDEPSGPAGTATTDGHLWLDPANAKAIAALVATRLSHLDPADAARFEANRATLVARLDFLDAQLRAALAPVKGRPFIVFHDGYQYLEHRYGLSALGSITVDPEHQPGARRIVAIREKLLAEGAVCVFSEPEFIPTLVATVTAGTKARTGTLDGLGAALPEGPDLYPTLMSGLARSLVACLQGK